MTWNSLDMETRVAKYKSRGTKLPCFYCHSELDMEPITELIRYRDFQWSNEYGEWIWKPFQFGRNPDMPFYSPGRKQLDHESGIC